MTVEILIQCVYWKSVLLVLWAYVGYFMTMWLWSRLWPHPVLTKDWFPKVSLIICAHNEEKRIAKKLENTLDLIYPRENLELIVVSDASVDATESIVASFANRGVRLLTVPVRRGKHYAQHQGVLAATGEIVVLTDATTFLERDALSKITRSYADPSVGCVSGEDCTETADGELAGEGAYVKYEMKLRAFESRVNSIVGASGSFYSARRSLCRDWIDEMSSDFYIPIIARMNGYRAIVDHEAFGVYRVISDTAREFERKVRTVVHGLEVLFHFKSVMNPFKFGVFAFQIISHKLIRWLVPFALIAAFCTNILLLNQGWWYQLTLYSQLALYLLALTAYVFSGLQRIAIFKIPMFFVMVNLSILVAWFKYLSGAEYVTWEATKR